MPSLRFLLAQIHHIDGTVGFVVTHQHVHCRPKVLVGAFTTYQIRTRNVAANMLDAADTKSRNGFHCRIGISDPCSTFAGYRFDDVLLMSTNASYRNA